MLTVGQIQSGAQQIEPTGEPVQLKPLDKATGVCGVAFQDEHCKGHPDRWSKMPCLDEVTVLTEEEINTATHRRTGGDPLIVRGHATPGSTVRVFNPDILGWPEVAMTKADAITGEFRVQVDDIRLFARGDRVIVSAQEQGKPPSAGVMKETVPITRRTHVHSDYLDGRLVDRRVVSITTTPDHRNADNRAPYLDEDRVKLSSRLDRNGLTIDIRGAAKSVPPGTTLGIRTGSDVATFEARDDGSFELKVKGARPGQTLDLTLVDVHGNVTTLPVVVESLQGSLSILAQSATWLGNDQIQINARTGLNKSDAVTVRNPLTGQTQRLSVDASGGVSATLENVKPWSVIEMGLETQGVRANHLTRAVVLPRELGALSTLDGEWKAPSLQQALDGARIEGRGSSTSLHLPQIDDMPPFGRIDVLRDGKKAYELRADSCGTIGSSILKGVAAGGELSFLTFDAGGRRVGVDAAKFCAPGIGETSKHRDIDRASDNASLSELVALIGTGRIGMPAAGERAKLSAKLIPDTAFHGIGVREHEAAGRTDIHGPFPEGTLPEVAGASRYDSVNLAVVDWTTGQRNIVFELYQNNRTTCQNVQVPLPAGGNELTLDGKAILPDAQASVDLLKRTIAFAALAQSIGQKPGDKSYDAPMRAARTLLFAIDQIAVRSPEKAAELRSAAEAAIAPISNELVDASKWVAGTGMEGATSKSSLDTFWSTARVQRGVRPWELGGGEIDRGLKAR